MNVPFPAQVFLSNTFKGGWWGLDFDKKSASFFLSYYLV